MPYIKSIDRTQLMLCSLDSFVDEESIARIIDAFVESLDMHEFGIKEASYEGRPSYNPKEMFKLYIYGNRKGIRSSRKLEESCRINIEVKWIMGGLEPDFRTISDFRKNNIESMKKIFHEFNRRIAREVEWGFTAVDGSKFYANNSKDNNFTKNKLDDRIQWLDAHVEEYLRILEEIDKKEEREEECELKELIENKLKEKLERKERYEEYRRVMEEKGLSQLSLVDKDAKLMKSRNGFAVAYNPQTAVDSNTHLIQNFHMTNQVTDHGLLAATLKDIKKEKPEEVIETTADKGYENTNDMIECLENGIIPHVITDKEKDGYHLQVEYEEAEADTTGTSPEELKKALHAGQIPEVYKDVIGEMTVKEVRRLVKEDDDEKNPESVYGDEESMKARAKEGYFVRDPERNLVYCPAGNTLRQKSIKANGNIRYANKTACRHCANRDKCYKGKNEWKEIDFTKDKLEKPCKEWMKAEGKECREERKGKREKRVYEKIKVVQFTLYPDRTKTAQRMCLSEHPFGTIKRAMGATHFLLRGLTNVEGEFALFCLGYNLERAKNLLGFGKLMEMVRTPV